jgi:hypothetical protein
MMIFKLAIDDSGTDNTIGTTGENLQYLHTQLEHIFTGRTFLAHSCNQPTYLGRHSLIGTSLLMRAFLRTTPLAPSSALQHVLVTD